MRLIAGLAITWIHCGCPTNAPLIASHSPGFESKHVRFDVPPSQTVRQLLTCCPLCTRCHLSLTCLVFPLLPVDRSTLSSFSQEIEYHQGLQGPRLSDENIDLHLRGFAACLDDGGALRLQSWIEEARLLALESSAVFGTPRLSGGERKAAIRSRFNNRRYHLVESDMLVCGDHLHKTRAIEWYSACSLPTSTHLVLSRVQDSAYTVDTGTST